MRAAVLVAVVVSGCTFQPSVSPTGDDDGGGGDDGGMMEPDACGDPEAFDTGIAAQQTIYVAPSEDPQQAPDGTPERPFPGLEEAAPRATPGTRIVLAPGNYPAGVTLSDLRGTATAPIWIEGPATGDRAALEGNNFGLHLESPQYLVIRNLDMKGNMTGAAFNIDDGVLTDRVTADHVEIAHVRVERAAAAFRLTGVDNIRLLDIDIDAGQRGVQLAGVHHGIVADIRMHAISEHGIKISAGSTDLDVRRNRIEAAQRALWLGGGTGITEFRPPLGTEGNYEAADIRFTNNVIVGGQPVIVCGQCTDSLIASNLIRGDDRTSIVFNLVDEHGVVGGFVASGKLRVLNNVIEAQKTPSTWFGATQEQSDTCTFSHNLWYDSSKPDVRPAVPSADPGAIFMMASGYDDDGRLCSGAAIHAGAPIDEVRGTLDGSTCRPDPPSVGPSEPPPGGC